MIARGLRSFCANYARIIKVHVLTNKVTFKRKKGINSILKTSMIVSDFPLSNIVKLVNVGPTFPSFRPLLSHSSVATTLANNFCD